MSVISFIPAAKPTNDIRGIMASFMQGLKEQGVDVNKAEDLSDTTTCYRIRSAKNKTAGMDIYVCRDGTIETVTWAGEDAPKISDIYGPHNHTGLGCRSYFVFELGMSRALGIVEPGYTAKYQDALKAFSKEQHRLNVQLGHATSQSPCVEINFRPSQREKSDRPLPWINPVDVRRKPA